MIARCSPAQQLGQTLLAGSHDRTVLAAGLGSAALLAVLIQTPGLSHFFGCTPLGPVGWGVFTADALGVLGVLLRRAQDAGVRAAATAPRLSLTGCHHPA